MVAIVALAINRLSILTLVGTQRLRAGNSLKQFVQHDGLMAGEILPISLGTCFTPSRPAGGTNFIIDR